MTHTDLSQFDNLDATAAEQLAGRLNVEFHPIVCERVSGRVCAHVSPSEREHAVSVAAAESRIPEQNELLGDLRKSAVTPEPPAETPPEPVGAIPSDIVADEAEPEPEPVTPPPARHKAKTLESRRSKKK